MAFGPDPPSGVGLPDKRRLLLLVRTALTVGIGYLLVFGAPGAGVPMVNGIFAVAYVASNLVIAWLPAAVVETAAFDVGIVLADTLITSGALFLMPEDRADVFLFYFVIVLLASVSGRFALNLLAPVLATVGYVAFLLVHHPLRELLEPAVLLRIPFFLLAGAFYAFFADRARRGEEAAIAARQRERAKVEYLSLITHDLKQPLWVAQQSAALLYERLGEDGDPDLRTLAAQVSTSLRRMEALTMNFLELARIESRGVRVHPERVSLNRLVRDVFDTFRPAFDLRKLHPRLRLADGLPPVLLDPVQFERCLANLLDNAIKFTPPEGEIVCETHATPTGVEVVLGDSGPGIRPEEVERLFRPFEPGDEVRGRKSTGLGLYIARAIVRAHGGEIALDPNRGPGAWLVIRLPRAGGIEPCRTPTPGAADRAAGPSASAVLSGIGHPA